MQSPITWKPCAILMFFHSNVFHPELRRSPSLFYRLASLFFPSSHIDQALRLHNYRLRARLADVWSRFNISVNPRCESGSFSRELCILIPHDFWPEKKKLRHSWLQEKLQKTFESRLQLNSSHNKSGKWYKLRSLGFHHINQCSSFENFYLIRLKTVSWEILLLLI